MSDTSSSLTDIQTVKDHWSQKAQHEDLERRKYVDWMNHPFIDKFYINRQISKNPEENWLVYVNKNYVPKTLDLGLTLGCGHGGLERHALSMGMCRRFEAFDIAEGAIDVARDLAVQEGINSQVRYEVTNINQIHLEPDKYDIVFASMSAHHFSELEHIYNQVRTALKPSGFFVLNEYVGPTQFQWTDEQLAIINDLLKMLPDKYREYISLSGQFKQNVGRLTIDEMNSIDPSEAIRSAEVLPLLKQYFNIVERIDYGGTILHQLMQDIVGNFAPDKEQDIVLLNLICYLEETLIKKKIIPSDFALIIAQNNQIEQIALVNNTSSDEDKNMDSSRQNYHDETFFDVSSKQLAQQIPTRRLIKAILHKIMTKFDVK
jgi:SAM-dependent methyltransferase